jgi:hypothetical protein
MTLDGHKVEFTVHQGGVKWCLYHKQDYRLCGLERALALLVEAPNVRLSDPAAVADYVKRVDAFLATAQAEFHLTPEEIRARDDQLQLEAEEDARIMQDALAGDSQRQEEEAARAHDQEADDRLRSEGYGGPEGGPDA